jgi:hypothetical protein
MDEVAGGWRKLLNEELHNLYSSSSIIRIVTRRLKAGIAEPEYTFIARKRLGKQVPAEMNMHATVELPFLCSGEVNTPLQQ